MSAETSYTGPLWIPGKPVTKGSYRCITPHIGGRRGVLVPEKTLADPSDWHNRVPSVLALKAPRLLANPLDGPLELVADFYVKAPKTSALGLENGPIGHGTGDLDKLTRALGDGITASGLITDDSRITDLHGSKSWGEEGCRVELRPAPARTSTGTMPVRIQAGATNRLVGHIGAASELPALLRKVADAMEGK